MSNEIKPELQLYPHIPDPRTIHDQRYDPNSYISVQSKVNNDENYEKMYILKLAKDGWVALKNVKDIFLIPKGKPFKYRLNGESMSGAPEGTFRSGGWLIGKNLDDPDYSDDYILYKAYNGAIFSLQIKDILEVYIQSFKKDIQVFKKPAEVTNYPVYLPDPETGKQVAVYYARDNYRKKRFMESIKYKKALLYGKWSWSVVFND